MKVFKGHENLLLKNLQEKTRVENVRFLSWRIFFVGKYGIQSTNEMAFKRTVTLGASFRFPAIRFDVPKLLSFSGLTRAHAKCPPVGLHKVMIPLYFGTFDRVEKGFYVPSKKRQCLMALKQVTRSFYNPHQVFDARI